MTLLARTTRSRAAGPSAPAVPGLLLGALVAPAVPGRPAAWWALDDAGRDVVVQRVRPAAAPGAPDEVSLRRHLAHPHAAPLLRVARCREGAVQVLGPVPGGSLPDLLAERGRLEPGEVVVLVAGVGTALDALHEEGLAHGEVEASGVLVGEGGMPLLLGWGAARPVLAARPDVRRREVRAGGGPLGRPEDDVRALARLGLLALGVPGAPNQGAGGSSPLAALLAGAAGAGPGSVPAAAQLARDCWELVAPVPLGSGTAGAAGAGRPAGAAGATAVTQRVRRSAVRAAAPALPVEAPRTAVRAAVSRAAVGMRAGLARRPLWWAVLALAVAAVLAGTALVALVPPAEGSGAPPVAAAATPQPVAAAATPQPVAQPVDPRLAADDPAAAVPALAALRAAAISAGDPARLDAVDVAGSAAAARDSRLITALAGGRIEGLAVRVTSASLAQRAGDDAWVDVVSVVSAHRVVTAGRVTDVPEGAPVTSRLLLRRVGGAWAVADAA